MASSGWQSEQLVYNMDGNNILYGNVYIASVEHTGTNVNVVYRVAFGNRGTAGWSCYFNNGVQVAINGGSWHTIVPGGASIVVGGGDYYYPSSSGTSSTTITGVPAGSTSATLNIRFRSCNANDCSSTYFDTTKGWTLSFDASETPPSGLSYSNQVVTWDSLTATVGVSNWGSGGNEKILQLKVCNESYVSGVSALQETSTGSNTATLTVTNMSEQCSGTGTIPNLLGCGTYYPGLYASNGAAAARLARNAFTTPPAPGILNYTRSGNVYTFTYRGVPENNNPSYLASLLKRTFRYKINNGNWVYVDNAAQRAIDYENMVAINVAAGTSVTVEGWNTYGVNNLQSEVSTETVTNTDSPVYLYGSVEGEAKKIDKLYASVLDESKELLYLYASVNGEAKRIFEA